MIGQRASQEVPLWPYLDFAGRFFNGNASALAATTVAAAATTATTTTAAVATPTASAATTTAAAIFAWLGFVHSQRTTIVFLFVQALDGLTSGVVVFHFDESETLATPRVTILNDLGAADRAELGKQLLQSLVRDAVAQVSDVQFFSHRSNSSRKTKPTQSGFPGRERKGPRMVARQVGSREEEAV
jgi:hypothetical protein